MVNIILGVLLFFQSPGAEQLSYFYFGNTNVVGVGILSEGEKTGEWKVYSKSTADPNPIASLEPADPLDFKKNFNQEFPLFIIQFEKGIPNGPFLENYPNGKPKVVASLKEGVLDGDFGEFYPGGELHLKGKVLEGKKEGEWLEYSESGQIISTLTYSDGLIEGKGFGFYSDGDLQWEGNFKKGELDGPFAFYLPDSILKTQGQYVDGIPVGEWVEKLEILPGFYHKGTYQNGLREGEWQLTDLEGEFLQGEFYEEGRLVSVGKFQIPDSIEDKSKVKNGNGQRYFYDKQGNILARGKISKGIADGLWYFYFPESDRVSASGNLEGTDRVGSWSFYSYEGDLLDQQVYYKESSPIAISSGPARPKRKRNSNEIFGTISNGEQGTGIFGQGWNIYTFQNRGY
ncbi:antitoxin component YwqK of YwqJK toxin-antitoxin module [Algoriphagus boseongensis]|uniref:Antitoxin component YwqK of YwqJK toxin-antitoxin module n=1 Tax=Algoriphagus boseongensis TaxID=1442587 RepID=A0A4R6T7U6_9BACT|nr:hypothetical protein [Algoriphagus boseongensis]TDQ17656.1 antitoxin component YwqK of YwqJK toxin-antitoxin module [Algoriphagus boseongensis]